MGDYCDGDANKNPTILWNLCLIAVSAEKQINVNIYLHLIPGSLTCH